MATDAFIDKIGIIKPHPDADRLEICFVRSSQCVIAKGVFERFEQVLKVEEDAKLDTTRAWVQPYRDYLGNGDRVKSVRLRGVMSRGLVVSLKELEKELEGVDLDNSLAVCEALGITHYERPCKAQDAKGNLPPGIEKSDEENWQTLKEDELHLGEEALLTYKIDGSSAVLYYDPHLDTVEICSRSLTLKTLNDLGQPIENNYIKALTPYIERVKALAKSLNEIVAIRGEIYGNNINGHKVNMDAKGPLAFAMYGVRFPESDDPMKRKGRWGSGWHFLDVNEKLQGLNQAPIPTVPVKGTATVTKELLFQLSAEPAVNGEGTVLNGKDWSYKAKSDDYCSKMK